MPGFFFTNSKDLRELLLHEKTIKNTLELVEMHLALKELVNEGFKVINEAKKKSKISESTIEGFNEDPIE